MKKIFTKRRTIFLDIKKNLCKHNNSLLKGRNMKFTNIIICLSIGMLSSGVYNEVFASNNSGKYFGSNNQKNQRFTQKNVVIPSGTERISRGMFDGRVESIIIPDSVKSIDRDAFKYTGIKDIFVYNNNLKDLLLKSNLKEDMIHVIPQKAINFEQKKQFGDGEMEKAIDEANSKNSKTIVIDSSYSSIGGLNRDSSKMLKFFAEKGSQIVIPSSVTSIRPGLPSTAKIVVPCERMKNYMEKYLHMTNIEVQQTEDAGNTWAWNVDEKGHLAIPDGVEFIYDYMFDNRRDIKSISIPDSVKCIGKSTLGESWSIRGTDSVIFYRDRNVVSRCQYGYILGLVKDGSNTRDKLITIVPKADKSCVAIVGNWVDTINRQFLLWDQKYVSIPNSVKTIVSRVKLWGPYVVLPNSIQIIGGDVLQRDVHYIVSCDGMRNSLISRGVPPENITVDAVRSNAIKGAWWWNVDANGHLEIPDCVQHLDDYMFFERKDIKSIKIPDSVKTVGQGIFYNCKGISISSTNPELMKQIAMNYFYSDSYDCQAGYDHMIHNHLIYRDNPNQAISMMIYEYCKYGKYHDVLRWANVAEAYNCYWSGPSGYYSKDRFIEECIQKALNGDRQMLDAIVEVIVSGGSLFKKPNMTKLLLDARIEGLLWAEIIKRFTNTPAQRLNSFSNMYRIFGVRNVDEAFELWNYFIDNGLNYDNDVAQIILSNVTDQRGLAEMYDKGGRYVARNISEAVRYYAMLANNGDIAAIQRLAEIYDRGELGQRNINEAARYYAILANNDYANAQQRLIELLNEGLAPTDQNVQIALFNIGINHYNRASSRVAFNCCTAIYQHGYVDAALILGLMYEQGMVPGVAANIQQAQRYYVEVLEKSSNQYYKQEASTSLYRTLGMKPMGN